MVTGDLGSSSGGENKEQTVGVFMRSFHGRLSGLSQLNARVVMVSQCYSYCSFKGCMTYDKINIHQPTVSFQYTQLRKCSLQSTASTIM